MKYFSGFCFQYEYELFKDFLCDDEFCVVGFSYGAIKAFEYVCQTDERVDELLLISPAFFQDRDESFKKLQLSSFKRDSGKYVENFYKNALYPDRKTLPDRYKKMDTYDDLKRLLYYKWDKDRLEELKENALNIEVYLGESDKIIDSEKVLEFFREYATIYYLNERGHLL